MEYYFDWTIIKYIRVFWNIKGFVNKARSLWHYIQPPYRIIVFGASGTGKTQFISQLREIPPTKPKGTYRLMKHKIVLKNHGRRIHLYDTPGHILSKQARDDIKDEIIQNKIKGIINVVSYGYAEREKADTANVFKAGTNDVKQGYLNDCLNAELKLLDEWVSAISKDNRVKWIITLINKADIWSGMEDDAFRYYSENGKYLDALNCALQHCKHYVLKYCCRIEPFYDKPMTIHKGERYTEELRKDFNNELIRLISENDDANAE